MDVDTRDDTENVDTGITTDTGETDTGKTDAGDHYCNIIDTEDVNTGITRYLQN